MDQKNLIKRKLVELEFEEEMAEEFATKLVEDHWNLKSLDQITDADLTELGFRRGSIVRFRAGYPAPQAQSTQTQGIDYNAFPLWICKPGYGVSIPPQTTFPTGWPFLTDFGLQKLQNQLEEIHSQFRRFAVTGRRRIGKTTGIREIAIRWASQSEPILYCLGQTDLVAFVEEVKTMTRKFDPSLVVPEIARELVVFLCWLLRSGVTVIIDEFQRLCSIPSMMEHFQAQFDQLAHVHPGKFITLGSHVTEMERIILNQQSPLFGRNFTRIHFAPLSVREQVLLLSENFSAKPSECLRLYTCFNGILGLYEDFFGSHNYLSPPSSIQESDFEKQLLAFINKYFENDTFYRTQIHAEHSKVLEALGQYSGQSTLNAQTEYLLRTSGLRKSALSPTLEDLERHRFIRKIHVVFPLTKDKDTYYWKLLDNPLRVLTEVVKGKSTLSWLEGWVWEEICSSLLSDGVPGMKLQVHQGSWSEPCTEIDVVAVNEEEKIIFWGSCKRSSSQQSRQNLLAHVISFFNNRGYREHQFYHFQHHFFFLSPTFTERERDTFGQSCTQFLNQLLHASEISVLDECVQKLSNIAERGNPFKWSEKRPGPGEWFTIASCKAYSLLDMVKLISSDQKMDIISSPSDNNNTNKNN